jgi:hypothetical protein
MEDHAADGRTNGGDSPCYLLKLPGELRNEIFSLALYHPGKITWVHYPKTHLLTILNII